MEISNFEEKSYNDFIKVEFERIEVKKNEKNDNNNNKEKVEENKEKASSEEK